MNTDTTKEYRIEKTFADKLLKALRSGEFKQVQSQLEYFGEYCVLGLIGHLCGVKDFMSLEGDEATMPESSFIGVTLKPDEAAKYPADFRGMDNPLCAYLSNLNDNGESFESIADWIEANCEFYETE